MNVRFLCFVHFLSYTEEGVACRRSSSGILLIGVAVKAFIKVQCLDSEQEPEET